MKVLFIIVLVVLVASVGLGMWNYMEFNSKIVKLNTEIVDLNEENTRLVADNIQLVKSSYLKSFENEKSLERFIKASTTSKSFTSDDYASEACISLMVEAREKGYWMGITMENMTDESFWSALYRKTMERSSVKWIAYNVAIVGDGDIYFIDPLEENTAFYYIMTMGGDFSKYSEKDKQEVHVLR